MPTYTVQAPSGRTYEVEGPEGATPEQLGQFILSQSKDERIATQVAADRKTYAPTGDFFDNLAAGAGRAVASVGRALGGGSVLDYFGLPGSKEEAATLDAPLMSTAGGKTGNVLGMAAIGAPVAMIPGANTYAGAAMYGAGFGGLTTEGGLADRAKGAAWGGAGGLVGKGAGDLLGWGFSKLADRSAANAAIQQAANQGKDEALAIARDRGFVIPPADASGGLVNNILQGVSGKIKTAQAAAEKNQAVTNSIVKEDLGLPADLPISKPALAQVRSAAGKSYDAVESAGTIKPGPSYDKALDAIEAPYLKAAAGFPNAPESPVIALVNGLRSNSFDAGAAVSRIKMLRAAADTAYAGGNKEMGGVYKDAASALENAIDQHLVSIGAPASTLQAFRDARTLIAKTYTAEKALNPQTGDINAQALGTRLKQGKAISGGMEDVAKVAATFPKPMQPLKETTNAVSPLDFAVASLGDAALLFGRPAARTLILSKPYQAIAAKPGTYSPSASLGLLDTVTNAPAIRNSITGSGMGLLSLVPASQQ